MVDFDLFLLTFTYNIFYAKKIHKKTLRENIQNNVYKFILIFIVISVIIFAIQDQGFFFNIKI